MPTLLVLIGSTRPGRVGPSVADWFAARVVADGRFTVHLVDLAQRALPMLDEPVPAVLGRYTKEHTRAWSAVVDAADAIVIVTPEYNHGYPAGLKNALDYLFHEWRHKPVGFVSYGGVAAGTRAVQQLQQVVAALQMVPAPTAVRIPFVAERFDERGLFVASDSMERAADAMCSELGTFHEALSPLRTVARASGR
ncbi:NADPH-dependent FMN reductase [Pseudonocardia broussonetiae]|uniref:NAD(P)H-dependent oxidoreductase n=1 Tax=Pseudonocardia broussonetiae TaxID=2736640 RepID=A0A6M6JLT8_9PSEU|nr:NAD(P)H-dependent oxidoreductase [Pseudonocardia broussonetiae]QJY48030.1 NAD(P)H-dependent oxidoreductase [Pseudonocardia broussonetiae]